MDVVLLFSMVIGLLLIGVPIAVALTDHSVLDCLRGAPAGRSGNCGRVCLYVVRGVVRLVSGDHGGHRFDCYRRDAAGGLLKGIRRWCDL